MPEVEVDSISLHYEAVGEGPPVLFIHGLGSSSRDWERQVEVFAKTHRVVTVDLRGHGQSDKPSGPYTIELFSEDIAGLIGQLGVAPVIVVGISLGGMVAFQLAADHRELLAKLVVVNALPDNKLLQEARGQILMRKLIVRFLGLERMGKILAGRLFPGDDLGEERAMMAKRLAENDKKAYQESFRAAVSWPGVTGQLEETDLPMLMISSDEDYVPVEQKQPYVNAMPGLTHVVIEDARHAVPVERPTKFNRALGEFLAG